MAALWRLVVGRPLRSSETEGEQITPVEGLSALSLDALTSVAYGPEAIIVVLAAAGAGALHLVLPVTLVIVGLLSDWLKVRKPFMIVGAVGAAVMTIIYLGKATDPHTGYYEFVLILSLLAAFMGIAYAPWMASFTETVERRNPALIATGLAVWGWLLRIVVAVSVFVLPYVVSSTTPLVQYGAIGQKAQAIIKSDPNVSIVLAHPAIFTELAKYPKNAIPPALLSKAVAEVGIKDLTAVASDPKITSEVGFLQAHAKELAQVQTAAKVTPGQWQNWYWVCVGGELVFLPLVLVMAGRWSPSKAREDLEEHERLVAAEMAKLAGGAGA